MTCQQRFTRFYSSEHTEHEYACYRVTVRFADSYIIIKPESLAWQGKQLHADSRHGQTQP